MYQGCINENLMMIELMMRKNMTILIYYFSHNVLINMRIVFICLIIKESKR